MRLMLEVEYPGDDCPTLRTVDVDLISATSEQIYAAVQLAVAEYRAHLVRLAGYRAGQPCTGRPKSH